MYDHLHLFVITLTACEFCDVIDILQKWQKELDVQECHLCLLNFLILIAM